MAVSIDKFAASLAESGLLSEADLIAYRTEHNPADAEQFARGLVKQKLLTAYQAQQAYAGKAKALVLGNYVILDKLGQGGMGMVLKARHKRMNRIVALKVLSPAVVKTPDILARFQREVQAAARLEHQNIVSAYDADEANGTHFFVMQYVEGSDLSSIVKTQGPLPVDQAVHSITQAARGLEFAHKQGVIHRDIKPANLLLDKDGTVKILDMGLARIEGDTGANAELTSTGTVMGTVDYMAPEQAVNTKNADARSDIYSLGISLWYLLTGRAVYLGDSLMARLLAHANQPIPSLREARPEVPEALDAIFVRMVAKKPEERFASMTDVLAALSTCQQAGADQVAGLKLATESSEESRFNQFLGLPGADAEPGTSPARTVHARTSLGSRTSRNPTAADATVTAARKEIGTDPVSLTVKTRTLRRRSLPPWWADRRIRIAGSAVIAVGMLSLLFLRNRPEPTPPATTVNSVAVLPSALPASVPAPSATSSSAAPAIEPRNVAPPSVEPPRMVTPPETPPPGNLAARLLSPDYEWSAPVNLGPRINSSHQEMNPRLTADGKRLWFWRSSGRYVANRSADNTTWDEPQIVARPIGFQGPIANLFVTPDEKALLFASWGKDAPVRRWISSRTSPDQPWGTPELIPPLDMYGGFPVMSADQRSLYFSSFTRLPGIPYVGADDIYVTTRTAPGASWSQPVNLGQQVNSTSGDRPCWISDDECVLMFQTNRESKDRLSSYRLYWTYRNSRDSEWAPAVPLPLPVSEGEFTSGGHLSPDGMTLYFECIRSSGFGEHDLWQSQWVRKSGSSNSGSPSESIDLLADRNTPLKVGRGVETIAGIPHFFPKTDPGDEYTLEFELEREAQSGGSEVAILVGGNPCTVHLHSSPARKTGRAPNSGLSLLDGQPLGHQSNPTRTTAEFIPDGTPFQLVCQVQRNRVEVKIDGKTVIDWTGDPARLSPHPNLATSTQRLGPRLGLVQYNGTLLCHRATLIRSPASPATEKTAP